jgi:tetratricopeptide (TPR) repeat protein
MNIPLDSGETTQLTLEAEVALRNGDTVRAQELFQEAGKKLERAVRRVRKESEKGFLRFLAATQYYKGGHYQEAGRLCNRIQGRLLSPAIGAAYEPFLQDVRMRCAPDYSARMRGTLGEHYRKQQYQEILLILQSHPYLFPPAELAFLRAVCCANLNEFPAAALFYADALRFNPDSLGVLFGCAGSLLHLIEARRFDDARVFAGEQLKRIPHPITHISLSMLSYHQASEASQEEEKRRFSEDQTKWFEKAWEGFRSLPTVQSENADLREYMILCLQAAPFGYLRLGRKGEAERVCDEAVVFAPSSAGVRAIRALITYPAQGAITDWEEALRLGDPLPYPHFYLAHAALRRGDFATADLHCVRGLERTPGQLMRAQLLEWRALCRWHLGDDQDIVRKFFVEALTLAPEDAHIANNRILFEHGQRNGALSVPEIDIENLSRTHPDFYVAPLRIRLHNRLAQTTEREVALLAS